MERHHQTWGVIRSILHEKYSFGTIKAIAGRAGLDMIQMSHLEQTSRTRKSSASKSQVLSAIDAQVACMEEHRFIQFLRIVTEEMLRRQPLVESDLLESLERLGWMVHEGHLVEVTVLDVSDLLELPQESHVDLIKAATRLRDNDLSGAVSAACAAVDAATSSIYQRENLGNPGAASFQEKVSRSLEAINIVGEIEKQLVELDWDKNEATMLAKNVRGSLNQASFVLQSLRSKMGDVHGTKPILKPLVFDSIKWSTLIVRLLK
ncbi:MAG: hypothetical protein WCO89_06095 [Syntrophus sp. (in: bacteria)]